MTLVLILLALIAFIVPSCPPRDSSCTRSSPCWRPR